MICQKSEFVTMPEVFLIELRITIQIMSQSFKVEKLNTIAIKEKGPCKKRLC